MASKTGSKKPDILPKKSLSNVQIILLQPVIGPNGTVQDKMSLNTLWEAAKFVEMQEHQMLDPNLATTTIRPVTTVNGGTTQVHNGTSGPTQTFTLHPLKLLNTSTANANVGTLQSQQPQPTAVVISSSNISSTFLQGVQGPISITTASPTITPVPNGFSHTTSHLKKEQDGHISSTTATQNQRHRVIQNSFDIINPPLVIDESGPLEQKKIKQPPLVFRSGTREVHNKLEKHRRAHLKECFDLLKKQLPSNGEEKKTSNLSILHSALRYIHVLKRREQEYEHEMERLAREKISYQQRLASLKKDNVDFSKFIPESISSSSISITQNSGMKRDSGDSLMSSSPTPSHSSMSPVARVVSPSFASIESIKMEASTVEETYCDASNDDTASATLGNTANIVTVASPSLVTMASSIMATVSSSGIKADAASSSPVINQTNSVITTTTNGESKISIPILGKTLPMVTTTTQPTGTKEVTQPVQTTGISVLPMSYPVNQGLVLQKVAIVPHKGLTDLAPLMPTHIITTPQQLNGINSQINGKVVPLTQYIVKPMVVVSTANPRPGS